MRECQETICGPKLVRGLGSRERRLHWCTWSYLYPREFSAAARAKVAAKKILAGRDFEGKKQSVRWVTEIEAAMRTYIFRVFLSFAEEACRLGRQGVWVRGASRAGSARVFVACRFIEAAGEKGFTTVSPIILYGLPVGTSPPIWAFFVTNLISDAHPSEPPDRRASSCILGKAATHRIDKFSNLVQNLHGLDDRWFVNLSWISEYPCILCQLNDLVDEWFQRLV